MCSNEELQASMGRLQDVVEENTKIQAVTKDELHILSSSLQTWRKTRCEENFNTIGKHTEEISEINSIIAKSIGQMAGAVWALSAVVVIGGLIIAYLQLRG